MFNHSIKNRVWQVIKSKIQDAQDAHNRHCYQVDTETKVAHQNIDEQAEQSKINNLESSVASILNKII